MRGATGFLRFAAVFVGLANLILLFGGPTDVVSAFRVGAIRWYEALLPVLATVLAGLVTSQLVLRWFKRQILAEKFSERYALMVLVVCLGGALTGGLLIPVLLLNAALVDGSWVDEEPLVMIGGILGSILMGGLGAGLGLAYGLVEGVFLAFPLAAILGLFRGKEFDPTPKDIAAPPSDGTHGADVDGGHGSGCHRQQ